MKLAINKLIMNLYNDDYIYWVSYFNGETLRDFNKYPDWIKVKL